MSKMLAEIRRIVHEDISMRVTQYDVLFESITNAIHANAKNITCTLISYDKFLSEEIGTRKLDSIQIVDDGDGFNQANYNSFCNYRTEFKKSLGCKGVGRFVFLKLYKNALFKSRIKSSQAQITFKFDLDFETDDIVTENDSVTENSTDIFLHTLTEQYYDQSKQIDRRIILNVETIRGKVLLNLIPTLFFYKKSAKDVTINFVDSVNNITGTICQSDIPNFNEKIIPVKDRDGRYVDFKLSYNIEAKPGRLDAFYCANNRTVAEFSDKDFNLTLPSGYSGFFLLESDYLDQHINNERNEFSIFPIKTDAFAKISWDMINSSLKTVLSELVRENIPEAENINLEKLRTIQDERPYLVNYIDDNDIDMAGFIDKKHIIEKAKKKFDIAKELVLTNAGKSEYTNQELVEAIQIAQNELVSYINDRAQVLERLRSLVDGKEQVEQIIHNLFMQRHTDDDYYSIGKNNLWLLDDRFTTYSYAASDKKISEVLRNLGESTEEIDNVNDKPDLSLFFSHDPSDSSRLKSVLIEIKPFDFKTKSDRKKFAGVQQLIDYVKAFKTKERIDEIYGFLITDVDKQLAERLVGDGYTPLYSQDAPIFHRFYDKLGISIYVVSAKTLILDAEARNKIFLEIVRKQSKLNNLLQQQEA